MYFGEHFVSIPSIYPIRCCHSDGHHGGSVCVCVCAAEKVSSLGKNWHRPCLRCERCSKTLAPGSHAEVSPWNHRLLLTSYTGYTGYTGVTGDTGYTGYVHTPYQHVREVPTELPTEC